MIYCKNTYHAVGFGSGFFGGLDRLYTSFFIKADGCHGIGFKILIVLSVTRKSPAIRRPKVLYVCGRIDGLSNTQSRFSTADWLVTAAGGSMLPHDDSAYFVTVITEEFIAWNPAIIIVSTAPSTDTITSDPRPRSGTSASSWARRACFIGAISAASRFCASCFWPNSSTPTGLRILT